MCTQRGRAAGGNKQKAEVEITSGSKSGGLVSERRRNRHFRKPLGSYPLQAEHTCQVLE